MLEERARNSSARSPPLVTQLRRMLLILPAHATCIVPFFLDAVANWRVHQPSTCVR